MDAPLRRPAPAAPGSRPQLALGDLLRIVAAMRATRLELVCWRLNIEESQAGPAWAVALRHELLERHGIDRLTGRAMFALSERGRHLLRDRGPRRRARANGALTAPSGGS